MSENPTIVPFLLSSCEYTKLWLKLKNREADEELINLVKSLQRQLDLLQATVQSLQKRLDLLETPVPPSIYPFPKPNFPKPNFPKPFLGVRKNPAE